MHTTRHKHHNKRLVEFFLEKAYPNGTNINELIDDNVLNGPCLAELAVSRALGIELHKIGIGRDLIDKSDIKTATVYEYQQKNRPYHRAQIQHLKNKVGKIRVITYNPFFSTWNFFRIPFTIHKPFSEVSISFDTVTGCPKGKYSKYEVVSWEQFCGR